MPQEDHVNISDLADLCTPWCLHVVATLRIADHIAAGMSQIEELAKKSGADADSLYRVLRHLVSKGVFEEYGSRQFMLNDAARGLLESSNRWLDLEGFGGRLAYAWGSLLSAVRTGAPAYHEVFGRPFWEDLKAHPKIAASFDALMGRGPSTADPDVLISGDWDSVREVVDVGGGTGSLLAAILRGQATVRGVLVDLPPTVARSGEVFQAAGVAERVRVVGQSFFDPLPAGGDLYLLKSILSDWPDREAILILKRCAEAARPLGRVIVLRGVSPEDTRPSPALLEMLLVGGKNRSLPEFRELARAAGLQVVASAQQPSGRVIVECRPTS
jgi:2,7-dihydroxy-5-methyl-1-naphthoate 7-O-methyltransferase